MDNPTHAGGLRSRKLKMDHQSHEMNELERYEKVDFEECNALSVEGTDPINEIKDTIRRISESLHFSALPKWLQDNDYLHQGHRAPTDSFRACFRSIFKIHTETFNIWTHLIGCLLFAAITIWFLFITSEDMLFEEKLLFLLYFLGAMTCLGFSFVFHTVCCHSERISDIFNKLDYCGISILITVSFVPWLYYCFYNCTSCKIIYTSITVALGIASIIVSLWDKFGKPHLRPFRAGIFITFGLSGVVPALHYGFREGFGAENTLINIGRLMLMGILYISGAVIYAFRVPERIFPGKCDIVFQSHQIFHICVVMAAFVHYYAVLQLAFHRIEAAKS